MGKRERDRTDRQIFTTSSCREQKRKDSGRGGNAWSNKRAQSVSGFILVTNAVLLFAPTMRCSIILPEKEWERETGTRQKRLTRSERSERNINMHIPLNFSYSLALTGRTLVSSPLSPFVVVRVLLKNFKSTIVRPLSPSSLSLPPLSFLLFHPCSVTLCVRLDSNCFMNKQDDMFFSWGSGILVSFFHKREMYTNEV